MANLITTRDRATAALPTSPMHTRWKNPTNKTMVIDVYTGAGRSGRTRYTIEPGAEQDIPSEYDDAICEVRNGVVQAGLAPLAVKIGTVTHNKFTPFEGVAEVHPSMDPAKIEAKAKADIEQALVNERTAQAEIARLVSTGKVAEAAELQQKQKREKQV